MLDHRKLVWNKFVKTTTIDMIYLAIVYMYASFFSPYLSFLGWDEYMKGIFFALFSIGGIFLSPILGAISDRVGRFKVIIFGLCVESITLIIYAYSASPFILLPLRILSAVAFFSVTLTALSRVNDTILDDSIRTKASGLFQSLTSIAILISPIIGGLIADAFGYRALFLTGFFLMILFIIFIFLYDELFYIKKKEIDNNKKQNKTGSNSKHKNIIKSKFSWNDLNYFADLKYFLKFKELRAMAILGFVTNFSVPVSFFILPYIILDKFHLTNTHYSIAIFLVGFIHLFQYYFGGYADKKGKNKMVIGGLLLNSIGTALMFFSWSYESLLFFLLIRSIGSAFWNVSAWSYISDIGEKYKIEGKVVGSYMSFSRMAVSLSYLVIGFLLINWGQGIFLLYGGLMFVALLAFGHIIWNNNIKKKKTSKQ